MDAPNHRFRNYLFWNQHFHLFRYRAENFSEAEQMNMFPSLLGQYVHLQRWDFILLPHEVLLIKVSWEQKNKPTEGLCRHPAAYIKIIIPLFQCSRVLKTYFWEKLINLIFIANYHCTQEIELHAAQAKRAGMSLQFRETLIMVRGHAAGHLTH